MPRRLPSRAWFENGYGIEWMQIGVSMQALDSVSGFLKKVVPKPIQELAEFIRFAFITVVNTVLLFAVYVVGIAPTWLFARLFKVDLGFGKGVDRRSRWIAFEKVKSEKSFYRQF